MIVAKMSGLNVQEIIVPKDSPLEKDLIQRSGNPASTLPMLEVSE